MKKINSLTIFLVLSFSLLGGFVFPVTNYLIKNFSLKESINLMGIYSDPNMIDYIDNNLYNDFMNKEGYEKGLIPVNEYNSKEIIWDSSNFGELYSSWMADAINDVYFDGEATVSTSDLTFVFDNEDVQNGNELIDLENQLGYFEANPNSDYLTEKTFSESYTTSLFGYWDLSYLSNLNTVIQTDLANEFKDTEFEYDQTWSEELELQFDYVIYNDIVEEYDNYYKYGWKELDSEDYDISNLRFIYTYKIKDSEDQSDYFLNPEANILLRDIDSISVAVSSINEESIFYKSSGLVQNIDMSFLDIYNPTPIIPIYPGYPVAPLIPVVPLIPWIPIRPGYPVAPMIPVYPWIPPDLLPGSGGDGSTDVVDNNKENNDIIIYTVVSLIILFVILAILLLAYTLIKNNKKKNL